MELPQGMNAGPGIEMVLRFDPATGQFSMIAPQDRMFCYGLLGMAHEALVKRAVESERRVQPVSLVDMGKLGHG